MKIRQDLVLVALGKRPADMLLARRPPARRAHAAPGCEDQEIASNGRRIAWVGPAGSYPGEAASACTEADLAAVPGFGEVHKHIESSHLTPEWEAALVLPRGNTWTCEASHEFSNVNGATQSRILVRGAAARLAAEDLSAARLGGAAHRL